MAKKKKIPFSVDRDAGKPLVAQVRDGLREAIIGGYYRPGDALPSYRALAPALGVSAIVTKAALRRIADEGLTAPRPRVGSVVRDRAGKRWLGHVLLVGPEHGSSYLQTVLAGALRDRLAGEGYLLSQTCVPANGDGSRDFSQLDAALARSVDLAVVLYRRDATMRRLADAGVPFAALAELRTAPRGAVGFTRLDYGLAAEPFADACLLAGAEEVVEFWWDGRMCDVSSACRRRGIAVRKVKVAIPSDASPWRLAAYRRAGMEAFASHLAAGGGRSRRTVHFFADDYLADGALQAMSYAGLRAPEDVRFAAWGNRELGPVYPREVSRMEMDLSGAAETVASAALAYLKTGVYPTGTVAGPKWIGGETMG